MFFIPRIFTHVKMATTMSQKNRKVHILVFLSLRNFPNQKLKLGPIQ